MVITRTPFRISLFGGGTDYPGWYREHGGSVIAATIDKYCYLTCRRLPPFFEHKYRVVYSKMENCKEIGDIQHPSVREVLRHMNTNCGMEIHHDGDLPARSGMGSSSSFTVGFLNAMHAMNGRIRSKEQLAEEAIFIEQDILKETVGSQDQVSAAHGGFNHIEFKPGGQITVNPMTISRTRLEELNENLMLFYTGIKRTASNVADSYVADISAKNQQLQFMTDAVKEGLSLLNSGNDLNAVGELLHETWLMKRSLSPIISNPLVDQVYGAARSAGALGGKLTGAGGGGFLLLFVPLGGRERIKEKLNKLIHVPFKFESSGSQVVFFDHSEDYREAEADRARQPDISAFFEMDPAQAFD